MLNGEKPLSWELVNRQLKEKDKVQPKPIQKPVGRNVPVYLYILKETKMVNRLSGHEPDTGQNWARKLQRGKTRNMLQHHQWGESRSFWTAGH